MGEWTDKRSTQFYAQTYDVSVSDWPGEMDFYRALVEKISADDRSVLEVACGTGRVTIPLAQTGAKIVGLDHSTEMLTVARAKSSEIENLCWVEGDMRSFDLEETFALVLIPGHSFQNLLTPEDQLMCLQAIKRHLVPGGVLVIHLDHQNIDWLGSLVRDQGGVFEEAESFQHPKTGYTVRALRAWSYEPSTQTAVVQTAWEEIDIEGQIMARWERGPIRIHCVFRFEMEHLLNRVGYDIQAVYGDFFRGALQDGSSEMVWVAKG